MADTILRLRVQSDEYDNKLKQAAYGLARYADECRKVGGTLEVVEKDTLDYVRALGQMDTTSRTATGKLAEMKKTFTELSVVYMNMTDQEKASPFGKALATSLDELKGRIGESKVQLDDINKSINGGGGLTGSLDALAVKFGLSIKSLTGWGAALAASKAALDVAKDAFFNNEEQLDEWGRTVESAQSLYNGFLNALNTGDISGYLKNIDDITRAARAAYDALDTLNTFNAFNQINVEKTRTGMTESIASYREGTGSREDVKAAGEAYKKELQERKKLEKEAYIEAVGKVAAERGVSKEDLLTALSGTYGSYQQLKNMPMSGSKTVFYSNGMLGGGSYYQQAYPNSVQEKLGDALRRLNDTELQSLQALGAQAERTGNEIALVDKQLTRVLNGRQGGAGGSTGGSGGGRKVSTVKPEEILPVGSVAALNKELSELQKQQSLATNTVEWESYNDKIKAVTNQIKELKGELGIEALRGMKGVGISGLSKDETTTREDLLKRGDQRIRDFKAPTPKDKTEVKLSEEIGKMTSGISSIAGGIESLGVELPQGLKDVLGGIQGVVSILTGISTIISAIEAISAADAVSPFANGGVVRAAGGFSGIVPGTTYSGDQIPAMLNAGEVVLNRAQAGNLASQLEGGMGNLHLTAKLAGHDLLVSIDRTARLEKGAELVFWKR